jgi:NAD(P)-dependent dehydrogenase (short-subunit alcohol dehydrogenase family)
MPGRLEGKVAVVTGGGSGIGRAGAVAMAAEGAKVVVADIDLERAEGVAGPFGGDAQAVDVIDTHAVEALVAHTVERHGSLDVLFHTAVDVAFVNNRDGRLTEMDDEVWHRMLDLVLTGTYHCVKHAGRQMIAQGGGSIVLTATTDALIGCAGLDAYTAAKGGVVAVTRSFAAGVARDGVRVNPSGPGWTTTSRARRSTPFTSSPSPRPSRSRPWSSTWLPTSPRR